MIGANSVGDKIGDAMDTVVDKTGDLLGEAKNGMQKGLDGAKDGIQKGLDASGLNYGIVNQVSFSKLAGWREVNYRIRHCFLKCPS